MFSCSTSTAPLVFNLAEDVGKYPGRRDYDLLGDDLLAIVVGGDLLKNFLRDGQHAAGTIVEQVGSRFYFVRSGKGQ